jgi:micrococcal nuclease
MRNEIKSIISLSKTSINQIALFTVFLMWTKLRFTSLLLLSLITYSSYGQSEKVAFDALVKFAQANVAKDAFAQPFLKNIASRTWTDKTGAFKQKASFAGFNSDTIILLRINADLVIPVNIDVLAKADREICEELKTSVAVISKRYLVSVPDAVRNSSNAPKMGKNIIVGEVIGVTDGDTVVVLDAEKTQYKIRLQHIDAPESNQAYGTQATKALSDYVFGKQVTVKWDEKDRYGRTLGNVFADDRWINKQMVVDGYAWHYKEYSKDEGISKAHSKAYALKKGLWDGDSTIAPWNFRRGERPKVKVTAEPTVDPEPSTAKPMAGIVYVTNSGKKYHLGNCRYLSKSKITISFPVARSRYGPCSVCKPPR